MQTQLHHCWALQMLRRQRGGVDTNAPKWALRNHMSFLVDNLQYYLQVGSCKHTVIIIHNVVLFLFFFKYLRNI